MTLSDGVENSGKFTLRQLADFRWTHGIYALEYIHKSSLTRAEGIIGFAVYGSLTEFAKIERTKERFWACANFITENHAVPGSLAGIMESGFVDVLDGHHRLAALLYLMSQDEEIAHDLPFWMIAA